MVKQGAEEAGSVTAAAAEHECEHASMHASAHTHTHTHTDTHSVPPGLF